MGDNTISLHLSETESSVASAPLHRLPGQDLDRSAAARVDFVVHHMLQALVVGRVQENLRLQLPPSVPVVHSLPPLALIPRTVHPHI